MYVPHDLEVGYKTFCSSLLLLDNVSSFSSRSPKPLIIIHHLPLFMAVVIDWHLGHILSHWDFYFLAHHLYLQHCFWWSWHSLTWSTQPLAFHYLHHGLPGGSVGKESACNAGDAGKCGFNPQVGKIPWRRAWQPTPLFLPRESHGQRSLMGCSPQGRKESDTTEATEHTPSPYFHRSFPKPHHNHFSGTVCSAGNKKWVMNVSHMCNFKCHSNHTKKVKRNRWN